MAIYEITTDHLSPIAQTTFDQTGLRERTDLQRLLKKQIDVVLPDTLIIAEEFGEWEESRRRIDLLALDKNANLIVIELKRTEDGGHMELQAIRYAAMISTMTFDRVVDVYSRYLKLNGSSEDAQSSILEFLGWEEPDEESFAQDVKIVLISSNFSKELTTAVIWLNKRDLDIRCIRMIPYQDAGRILIDVQQIIPLPEAAEYQIQIKEKELRERRDRTGNNPLYEKFWERLLALGKTKTNLHDSIVRMHRDGVVIKNIRGLQFSYVTNRASCRVEFYINKGSRDLNKRIFDELYGHRQEIDEAFGDNLSWERLDGRNSCRLAYYIDATINSDESEWETIHLKMIDAMMRLDKTVTPFIDSLEQIK